MEQTTKVLIRDIPADLVARVQKSADQDRRSRNSQTIILIEEALDQRDRIFESIWYEVREMRRAMRESLAAHAAPLRPGEPEPAK